MADRDGAPARLSPARADRLRSAATGRRRAEISRSPRAERHPAGRASGRARAPRGLVGHRPGWRAPRGLRQRRAGHRQDRAGRRLRAVTTANTSDAFVGRGQCIEQHGAGEAYLPVLAALGELCREPGGERLVAQLRKHAPAWLSQMPAVLESLIGGRAQSPEPRGRDPRTDAARDDRGAGGGRRGAPVRPGARGSALERFGDAGPRRAARAPPRDGAAARARHLPIRRGDLPRSPLEGREARAPAPGPLRGAGARLAGRGGGRRLPGDALRRGRGRRRAARLSRARCTNGPTASRSSSSASSTTW